MPTRLSCGFILAIGFCIIGCRERPSAPALRDEPVYDNSYVGLRFQSPVGWRQAARTDRPPPVEREHLLVRYQSAPNQKPALFEVTMQELPESTDLVELVRAPSHSLGPWTQAGKPEPITIGGIAGTRYQLTQRETMKECVVVRRDKNLFVFSVVGPKSDAKLRDDIREVLRGATWTK